MHSLNRELRLTLSCSKLPQSGSTCSCGQPYIICRPTFPQPDLFARTNTVPLYRSAKPTTHTLGSELAKSSILTPYPDMADTPTPSSGAITPPSSAAEQARIRKERREAKIRAGGSARLNKITGLGGGLQRGKSAHHLLHVYHIYKC
jgi:hypothetical protein